MFKRREAIAAGIGALSLFVPQGPVFAAKPILSDPLSAPIPGLTIAPEFDPAVVRVKRSFYPGSIHVVSSHHYLYLITSRGQAIRYGVAVGRAELAF
ncbi:MAG: L,D-transpeptidase, partial [Albidovulum sp.]